jgi:hypothetical protein
MVDDLHVVFDLVCQFNGHSVRRVEENLEIVRAILVTGSNPEVTLLVNRIGEPIFGGSNEICFQQFRPIVLECSLKALPSVQIVANCGRSGLIWEGAGSLKSHWFDANCDLGCHRL